MIQRVQSVFLAIAALSMVAMLFMPLWAKKNVAQKQLMTLTATSLTLTQDGKETSSQTTVFIAVLAAAAAGVAVYSLLSYRDRMKQMKLNLLNTLLFIATMGCTLYFALFVGEKSFEPEQAGQYTFGFFLPMVGLTFNSLANRFIWRDEKMVRSADRIR